MTDPVDDPVKPPVRVLLVDDDPVSLLVAGHIATSAGYDVTSVNSAATARLRMSEQSFDVLVCDHLMPDETGLELIDSILSLPVDDATGPTPRCILLTGLADADFPQRVGRVESVGFLTKPVTSASLVAAIEQAVHDAAA